MRSGNYFYLEECLISKYVKLTGLDEMIRTNIHSITCCLSVQACMSVRPTVNLFSISYASLLGCFLHRYIYLLALLTYHRLLTLIKKSIFIVFSAALSLNFGIEFHLYMDHDMDNCQQ